MFLPPECCSFDVEQYSMKKADIWSLGVTLYCLTFNKLPFPSASTEIGVMENICNHEITYNSRQISKELKQLLCKILEKDPSKRVSLTDLKNSSFFGCTFE